MKPFLEDLGAVLTGGGIIVAIIVYFGRTWFSQRIQSSVQYAYNRQLEEDKLNLSRSLEFSKGTVSALLSERQVRLSRLHDEVMETVSGTYARMCFVQVAMEEFVPIFSPVGAPSESECGKKVADALSNLYLYFQSRAIFLPDELYQEVFKFWKGSQDAAQKYGLFVQQNVGAKRRSERALEVGEYVRNESRKLLGSIKQLFRELLEVNSLQELKSLLSKAVKERETGSEPDRSVIISASAERPCPPF